MLSYRVSNALLTSRLCATNVSDSTSGTEYGGVQKLETVSLAELNAYVLTSPHKYVFWFNIYSSFLIFRTLNPYNSLKHKNIEFIFRTMSPPSHALYVLTQVLLELWGCFLNIILNLQTFQKSSTFFTHQFVNIQSLMLLKITCWDDGGKWRRIGCLCCLRHSYH